MLTPQILSRGVFPISRIAVEIHEDEWHANPEYNALVDAEWERLLQCSPSPMWDGKYYRVLNPATLDSETGPGTFRLGTVSFRYIATYRALNEIHARSSLQPLNHLSTVALIRTYDGFYVFGRRARLRTIDLIGGCVQQDEISVASGTDIEQNLYKEIQEEVGISQSDIETLEAIGIVQSSISNVIVVGHARAHLTKSDAIRKFEDRTEEEMDEPIFIPAHDLRRFLTSLADYRALLPLLLTEDGQFD
jgi:8-oxo-dGTP pyrophosphatase MutT (NUDIX family)